MKMNLDCVACVLRRNLQEAGKHGDEKSRMAFAQALMRLLLSMGEETSSPMIGAETAKLYQTYFGMAPDRFREEKAFSNRFVLERLDAAEAAIRQAEDPVLRGLQYAILGNYIDFSALWGKVDFSQLDELLARAGEVRVDPEEYGRFLADLAGAKRLVYLTDNAGEVCFDRLLGEALARQYPELEVIFCVRGAPVLNDATREDAKTAGLTQRFRVIDNGTAIAGTVLDRVGPEAREALRTADLILSKGQGNVETLEGCGLNVYYAFLTKCVRFTKRFGVPELTVMFCNERRMPHQD